MRVADTERDYEIYLFDRVLLCCREVKSVRKKKGKEDEMVLSLKGNIFLSSIVEIKDYARPMEQQFEIKVYWNRMSMFFVVC